MVGYALDDLAKNGKVIADRPVPEGLDIRGYFAVLAGLAGRATPQGSYFS